MISINELHKKWNSISPYAEGYLLVSGEHPLSFHIGYAQEEQKCFIVLNAGKLESVPSSKAISAECVQTVTGEYALRFKLNQPSLDELFIKLCWDLIDSSQLAAKPVEKIIFQYKSWMRLLQQAKLGLLSSSAQKGLIGELMFLEEQIDLLGKTKALQAWVGPEGSDQDFIFEEFWAEIKSTSIASESITISSIQQLDCNNGGSLIVYFMDKTSSKGQNTETLPDIVNRIGGIFTFQQYDEFFCKLAKAGYFAKDAEQYSTYRYKFAEKRVYDIKNLFPRLIRENIPTEIINARYELSLTAIDRFRR